MSRVSDLANLLNSISQFLASPGHPPITVLNKYAKESGVDGGAQELIIKFSGLVSGARLDIDSSIGVSVEHKKLAHTKVNLANSFVALCLEQSQWTNVISALNSIQAVDNLRLIDAFVSSNGYMEPFAYENAAKHADTIEVLIKELSDSDMPDGVKNPILAQLQALFDIFKHVDFYGLQNAEEKVKSLIGNLVVYNDQIQSASAESKTVIEKVKQFFQENYNPIKYSADAALLGTQITLLLAGPAL